MNTREILAQVATAGIAVVGTMLSIAVAEGAPEAILAFGMPMMTVGGYAFWKLRKNAFKRIRRDQEQELMRLFVHTGERYSLAEVALTLNLTVEDTRQLMDDLHMNGIFEIETTETGIVVYSIPANAQFTIGAI